jgi:outer membrane protein
VKFAYTCGRRGCAVAVIIALGDLAGASLPAQAPDTAARKITLADAIGAAQRNSAQAVQAHGQIQSAITDQRVGYAAFLPTLSVGVNSSFANQGGGQNQNVLTGADGSQVVTNAGQRNNTTNFASTGSVSLSYTVFDGGARIYDLRAARASLGAAEAGSAAQTFSIAFTVTQAYYKALSAREELSAGQTQLSLADSAQRIANVQVKARTAIVSDSLRASIQVATARVAIATALNDLASANATLSRLVVSPLMVTADPSDTVVKFTPLPDTAALRQLADTSPAVRQAIAQQSVSVAQEKAARAARLPQLGATYSFTGNGQNAFFGVGQPYTYGNRLSLAVSLPVLDQYQRQAAVERAQVTAANAGAIARDTKLATHESLSQAVGALELARSRMIEQTAALTAAREDLRVQLDRYRLQEATIIDVLTSQNELAQAQSALIQTRFDYRVARAQIESIIGRPL